MASYFGSTPQISNFATEFIKRKSSDKTNNSNSNNSVKANKKK